MEATDVRGDLILAEIASSRARIAQEQAHLAQKMLEFEDVRIAEAAHLDPRRRTEAEDAIRDELSLTLVATPHFTYSQLSSSRIVRDQLSETWRLYVAGQIDSYRVTLIGEAALKLTDDPVTYTWLDLVASKFAPDHTVGQLRSKLKRFVVQAEPQLANERMKAEREKRAVWFQPADDAMAYLTAYLPVVEAMRIHQLLETRAKNTPSEGRTFDARRADSFVDQMLTAVDGHKPSSGATIGITIPALSLAGLTDEPGESFDGEFALPSDLVRELAQEPGTLFHRIITDPVGHILDVTELGRFPSRLLRIGVTIRDGCCAFPTCSRPAISCDLDHQIPYPAGSTNADNLRALCRRHHRLKTAGVLDPYTASIRDAA